MLMRRSDGSFSVLGDGKNSGDEINLDVEKQKDE